jgi:hypothetical protein
MVLQRIINEFPEIVEKIININNLTNEDVIVLSAQIIIIAIIIVVISILIFILKTRKSKEEAHAHSILKKVRQLKSGNLKEIKNEEIKELGKTSKKEDKNTEKKEDVKEKKKGISIKDILIKKFKPKIESQLGTSIEILDFVSKGGDFEAKINVEGTDLTIIIDNSGKIIDYKKE